MRPGRLCARRCSPAASSLGGPNPVAVGFAGSFGSCSPADGPTLRLPSFWRPGGDDDPSEVMAQKLRGEQQTSTPQTQRSRRRLAWVLDLVRSGCPALASRSGGRPCESASAMPPEWLRGPFIGALDDLLRQQQSWTMASLPGRGRGTACDGFRRGSDGPPWLRTLSPMAVGEGRKIRAEASPRRRRLAPPPIPKVANAGSHWLGGSETTPTLSPNGPSWPSRKRLAFNGARFLALHLARAPTADRPLAPLGAVRSWPDFPFR